MRQAKNICNLSSSISQISLLALKRFTCTALFTYKLNQAVNVHLLFSLLNLDIYSNAKKYISSFIQTHTWERADGWAVFSSTTQSEYRRLDACVKSLICALVRWERARSFSWALVPKLVFLSKRDGRRSERTSLCFCLFSFF